MQDNAQTPIAFITGASGFLGRYVVAEALRRGYRVRAIAREKPPSWYEHPALEWVNLDLRTTSFEVFGNNAFVQI
ncbi:NAD-dependent epimerase/dehydratase family protein [Hydrococcus rivularis]|uniref:NAD-dependent epimerase/dehydratase family protein n=1 Tax=Hydrococcus rivularis TaxID=1616834 RepID=UPI0009FB0E63|nr:NAD-dependent epimerase/dehydratase family protein [Hydrococcus rivularis]